MLKLSNIKLAKARDLTQLTAIASEILGISEACIKELKIHRLSIDARRKSDVCFVYSLLVSIDDRRSGHSAQSGQNGYHTEAHSVTAHQKSKSRQYPQVDVSQFISPEPYVFPVAKDTSKTIVIVGMGPAGLFSALCLAEAGIKCVIVERGQAVDERVKSVAHFWKEGFLDEESNVQFGEGGAGTFSDGKLTTGINDRRILFVLERLVAFGAPEDILYLAKPHIGTDKLRDVVAALRQRLIELGCDVRFGHKLTDVKITDGALSHAVIQHGQSSYTISTDTLVLAPGNSARDTFEMLHQRGFKLTPKAFSVGVRIEHLQSEMDASQYGQAQSPETSLPASDYKLAAHLKNGRSVYTFCVCPGGQVVAAASEWGGVVTNGMSQYMRDDDNINGALLVSITPDDFGNEPLGGVAFQRKLEQSAFLAGGGNYSAPAQLVGDFLKKMTSKGRGRITPTYLPGVTYCNLWDVLPEFVCDALLEALPIFSKRIGGFADSDAIMTAVETRSSCPLRIERENYETVGIRGVFPCGEGAGYAGGIMSAAVDGIRCAEAIINAL
ncbi:MAG: FAD-binding protein [Oscillospiraceae bacterium]|nr:FAD-binding protein [Oscillospiraceae bacterium]